MLILLPFAYLRLELPYHSFQILILCSDGVVLVGRGHNVLLRSLDIRCEHIVLVHQSVNPFLKTSYSLVQTLAFVDSSHQPQRLLLAAL